jgi:hypothetical protein
MRGIATRHLARWVWSKQLGQAEVLSSLLTLEPPAVKRQPSSRPAGMLWLVDTAKSGERSQAQKYLGPGWLGGWQSSRGVAESWSRGSWMGARLRSKISSYEPAQVICVMYGVIFQSVGFSDFTVCFGLPSERGARLRKRGSEGASEPRVVYTTTAIQLIYQDPLGRQHSLHQICLNSTSLPPPLRPSKHNQQPYHDACEHGPPPVTL